jgi:hypothetical protein
MVNKNSTAPAGPPRARGQLYCNDEILFPTVVEIPPPLTQLYSDKLNQHMYQASLTEKEDSYS